MKKTYSFFRMAMMMALTVVLSGFLFSCESKDDEPDGGGDKNGLNVYPWKDYPKSYIRLFDNRMDFQILSVVRNGPTVQVEYTLTNARFGEDVSIHFWLNQDGAHDNLGNAYKANEGVYSDVIATINGKRIGNLSATGNSVTFLPNQTIKGSFAIKNFDKNATAFSISLNVRLNSPSDIELGSNRLDFVNVPVPAGESLEDYPWADHPESYIRMIDYRMGFKMLSIKREGTEVEVEYSLTNARFGEDVSIRFWLNKDGAHDNLGNAYKANEGVYSDVIATINGKRIGDLSSSGNTVTFQPNQTIIGTFTFKNFNKNATAFSISVDVSSDIILGADRLDFVNIPIPQ